MDSICYTHSPQRTNELLQFLTLLECAQCSSHNAQKIDQHCFVFCNVYVFELLREYLRVP
jgi:hypothetical protein